MKNKKFILIVSFTILIILLLYIFTHLTNNVKKDTALEESITKIVEESDNINFKEITSFDWDIMYVVTPYTDPVKLLKNEGIKVSKINSNIKIDDSINAIIFVKNNKAIKFIELSRKLGGMELSNYKKYNVNESTFKIENSAIQFVE